MPRIVVERPHALGREVIREKAEALASQLSKEYDIRYRWVGDVIEFRRSGADGKITVDQGRVHVELNLSLMLTAFASGIKSEIERTLDASL